MIKQSTLTAEATAEAILRQVRKLNLPLEKLARQGYEGCSMSRKFKGAKAVIKESFPQAVYVH